MMFPTPTFAIFFLIVFAIYWALRRFGTRSRYFLLAASYAFYAASDIHFPLVLFVASVFLYLVGFALDASRSPFARRFWLGFGTAVALANLAAFKYMDFFFLNIERAVGLFAPRFHLPFVELLAPVGLSFYTFQGISYLWDLHRKETEVSRNFFDFLLFMAFFPSIMSGPICRAKGLLPQIRAGGAPAVIDTNRALVLILSGLLKKVVLSSYLSVNIVDPVFASPGSGGFTATLLGIYSYSFQIYFDFSGYSDLAIGIAMLLGYRLPENFDAPYRAVNVQDFWRRWHMSLSSWLRDYLYIPLGGSRKGETRTMINILATMILCGLWHGAGLKYLVWGGMHGAAMVAFQIFRKSRGRRKATPTYIGRFLAWLLTFHFVTAAWVFFRASDLDNAFAVFRALAAGPAMESVPNAAGWAIVVIGLGLAMQFLGGRMKDLIAWVQDRLPFPAQGASFAALLLIIVKLGPEGIPPFIYFQY